jgi:hypothetical protein
VLAVLFLAVAAVELYCGVVGVFDTGFAFPRPQIDGLLFLVLAFMTAALGMGLWTLEEDARRAGIAFFAIVFTIGPTGTLVDTVDEALTASEVAWAIIFLVVNGSVLAYLTREGVSQAFDQLVTIRLGS